MDTKKLRQKILDLAIRGKLVPQDPNDEPASVLLERIRAEKERLIKEGKIKRSKKTTSDTPHYENEVPFEIPEGWCWCRLDDLAFYKKGPFGSSLTKSMFVPDSSDAYKVYEQKNAINKDATLGHYYIDKSKFEELKGFAVQPEDIIVSCAGTIGETYVLPHDIREGIINQALMTIRLFDKSISDFYLLYFDFILKSEAAKESKGTAIKNIPPFDILKNFIIPLPPQTEQKRIIEKVSYWLSLVDAIDGEGSEMSNLISKAKSKILDLAIHGKLVQQDPNDEPAIELLKCINPKFTPCDNAHYKNVPFDIPENWVWTCMAEVNEYKSASVDPSKSPDNNFELYSVPAYETGMPEFVKGKEISSSKKSVSRDDVLLCKINPHLNRAWIVSHHKEDIPCLASSEWIIFRNSTIFPQYLSYCFTSLYFKELMLSNVSGVGGSLMRAQPAIVSKYLFPLPPVNEQRRIVEAIQQYYNVLDNISANL